MASLGGTGHSMTWAKIASMATTRGETAGHILHGTLGAEDVRALFERCASLRFTGMLELVEGPRRASVPFVEGEPLDAPDLFKLGAIWRRGSYRLMQRAVDFLGNLTDGVVLQGSLRDTPPMQLFRHCEDGRLSAEIEIQSPSLAGAGEGSGDGHQARVRFSRGRLESAEVNGKPSMATLSTIGAWKHRLVPADAGPHVRGRGGERTPTTSRDVAVGTTGASTTLAAARSRTAVSTRPALRAGPFAGRGALCHRGPAVAARRSRCRRRRPRPAAPAIPLDRLDGKAGGDAGAGRRASEPLRTDRGSAGATCGPEAGAACHRGPRASPPKLCSPRCLVATSTVG